MSRESFTWTGYDGNQPAHRALQGFLALDVQYSSALADELHAKIQAYRQGRSKQLDGCGNGYEFECRPEGFYINCLYEGDPITPVIIEYDTVLQALLQWSQMCAKLERDAN